MLGDKTELEALREIQEIVVPGGSMGNYAALLTADPAEVARRLRAAGSP